jgi:hypothetical protein
MTYKTECGATVQTGDRVYNYYDMQPGRILNDEHDGWFRFAPDDGGQYSLLNGARICTIQYAQRRGFRGV